MISKDRQRLVKFGLEQEYLDWKTTLPVSLNQLKIHSEFIVIEGDFKGRKGKVMGLQSQGKEFVTNMKDGDNEIIITEDCLNMIKLI